MMLALLGRSSIIQNTLTFGQNYQKMTYETYRIYLHLAKIVNKLKKATWSLATWSRQRQALA